MGEFLFLEREVQMSFLLEFVIEGTSFVDSVFVAVVLFCSGFGLMVPCEESCCRRSRWCKGRFCSSLSLRVHSCWLIQPL